LLWPLSAWTAGTSCPADAITALLCTIWSNRMLVAVAVVVMSPRHVAATVVAWELPGSVHLGHMARAGIRIR